MQLELKYGLITGFGVCLWVLLEFLLGFHSTHIELGRYTGYGASMIPMVTLYLALKEKAGKEKLSWTMGLKTGINISIIAAVITTAFFLFYNHLINPGWMRLAFYHGRSSMVGTPEELAMLEKQFEFYSSNLYQTVGGIFGTVLMGIIISLIITFILRRRHHAL